jgi:hypothetical protein
MLRVSGLRCSQAAKEGLRAARDKLKPKIEALNAARFAEVKAARNASGLWWGNYNAVCASPAAAEFKMLTTKLMAVRR